jgi:hypothetical protein
MARSSCCSQCERAKLPRSLLSLTQTRDPIRALIKIKSANPLPDAGFVVSSRQANLSIAAQAAV